MIYIKNEEEMEEFRTQLREKRLEREWKKNNRGMSLERYKIFHEHEIIEQQKSGDELEDEVASFIYECFNNMDYYLIHDLILENINQLDLLLVTGYGVFIIEIKDWRGEYIVENGVWWKKGKNGEFFIKEDNENPTLQVKRHQEVLKTFLEYYNIDFPPIYRFIFINCDYIESDSRSIFIDKNDLVSEIKRIIENNKNALNPYNIRKIVEKIS